MTSFAVGSFTRDVSRGFAELLADEITGLAWDDTANYAAGVTGFWTDVMPADPDRLVLVSSNQVSADPSRASSVMLVQFRARGGANAGSDDASGLTDAIDGALLSRRSLVLPNGVQVWSVDFSHGGLLGVDERNRVEWATNYRVGVYRPGAHRK